MRKQNAVDLALDAEWDICLGDDGDLALTGGTAETDQLAAISQSVQQRLQFFAGEWFLDESVGIPWFEAVLIKAPNLPAVKAILRAEILGTRGVTDVTSINLALDSATRTLSVTWRATCDFGQITGEVTLP